MSHLGNSDEEQGGETQFQWMLKEILHLRVECRRFQIMNIPTIKCFIE
jgi:hypothetical protein